MPRTALLAVLIAFGVSTAIAQSQSPPAPRDSTREAEELARDALEKLMRAMGALIQSIPTYEMPDIQPNGDIVIRRKRPPEPKPQPKEDRT
jgi:hypothetical protein